MTILELQKELHEMYEKHGDIEVVFGPDNIYMGLFKELKEEK